MKKSFLFYLFFLFAYQFDNLAAMHYVKAGYKGDIGALASGNLAQMYQATIENEIDHAASTIKEWLTSELMKALVSTHNSGSVQLNTNVLDELSFGQRTFLTCWRVYPHYIPLIYAHSGGSFEHHYEDQSGSSRVRNGKQFTDALILHNFGNTFFEKIKQFSIREDLGVWELHKIMAKCFPYLISLFYKKQAICVGSEEFECILDFYDDQVRQFFPKLGQIDWHMIIFLLENPYFFMTHILTWSSTAQALDIIMLLVIYGFDINCQLGTGCDSRDTLLHRAVRYGYVEMVEYLLEWNADPLICYGRDEAPFNGGGQSPRELSCYKMRGETWITPNRPPSQAAQKIHAMLFAIGD